ncbi:NUDIX domain-containing protein [Streptomyces lasiicapitis]|uniref:NUDIX domain-containing protein n=1 Tax=Streptomyces lasiicapitis TaxID=1923961 RepID=UPI0036AA1F4F
MSQPQSIDETTETYPVIGVTADAVITTPGGRILLVKRRDDPYREYWALPGGYVEEDEKIHVGAARELAEETGVRVHPKRLRYVDLFDDVKRDPRGRVITVAYAGTVPDGTGAKPGDDADQARWWPLDALPPLAFDHADIIRAATGSTT